MSLTGERTYVGFGLGAIQTGLFLYEAFASGNFRRLVAAEVVPAVVERVRANNGYVTVNIAYADHIEAARFGPVEVLNPAVEGDRQILVAALAAASEIGTAVPGVRFYRSDDSASLCRILADGLKCKLEQDGPRAVVYTAENHNHAAELLSELVWNELASAARSDAQTRVQFLNTVIGKMSGVLGSQSEIAALRLVPTTPADDRAFLVEAFNHILISRIALPVSPDAPPFRRGITAFVEKDDLLPFEHAKLYGHNATHALAAYLGALMNCTRIAELPAVPGMLDFLRRAFVEESGAALIHRYHDLDPLFTPAGYAAYADDLLVRMCNPYLADTIERVGRDVERKLGWDDRLVGTMRLALAAGVTPRRYALGAAAALVALDPALLTDSAAVSERLVPLWGNSLRDPAQEQAVLALVAEGLDRIRRWHAAHGDSQSLLATF